MHVCTCSVSVCLRCDSDQTRLAASLARFSPKLQMILLTSAATAQLVDVPYSVDTSQQLVTRTRADVMLAASCVNGAVSSDIDSSSTDDDAESSDVDSSSTDDDAASPVSDKHAPSATTQAQSEPDATTQSSPQSSPVSVESGGDSCSPLGVAAVGTSHSHAQQVSAIECRVEQNTVLTGCEICQSVLYVCTHCCTTL